MEDRLRSILSYITAQKPLIGDILDLGCGDGGEVFDLIDAFPTAYILGIDQDLSRPKYGVSACVLACQADITALPFARRFDLILVRHPDVHQSGAWKPALTTITPYLAENAILLITCYSAPEVDLIRGWLITDSELRSETIPAQALAPVGLAGRDRYVLLFRRISSRT